MPVVRKSEEYLKSKHVDFEEHNIEVNEADRDACYQLTGDMMVPITTADDKAYVLGFDKAKIDALLNL